MNKNSDWYELSLGILNIFKMNRRFYVSVTVRAVVAMKSPPSY